MRPVKPPAECRQLNVLLDALVSGMRLTVLTALDKYGIYALSQRIGELEREYHWPIKKEWLKLPSGKTVRIYSL